MISEVGPFPLKEKWEPKTMPSDQCMVVAAAICVIQASGDFTTLQFLYFYALPMLYPCYVCAVPRLWHIVQDSDSSVV